MEKLEEVILATEETRKRKIYVKFPKHLDKQKKIASEQSQKELEPIIATPINYSMPDE